MKIIIVTVLVLILIYMILEYNKFTRLRNKVKQSKSGIACRATCPPPCV